MSGVLRGSVGAPAARVVGLGAYRPSRVVDNAEICRYIDSSDEWIRTRTGITSRRWADDTETLTVMAAGAAGKAMSEAGVRGDQIGCVLVATVSHLLQTPALATLVTHEIGANGAAAFDLSAACAGFVYGLSMANDMVRSGSVGGERPYVLVIGAERLTDLTDITDRSTAFLFADGAGAAVVGPADVPGISPIVWGADGSGADLVRSRTDWKTAFVGGPAGSLASGGPDAESRAGFPVADASGTASWPAITQEGAKVFRWAAYAMAPVAREALEKAGVDVADLDAFVPHQANMRIVDALAKAIGLPESVTIARDIAEQGNTSSASIPLALDTLRASGAVASGDTALLIGFGAGLVHAALVVTLP